MPIYHSKNLSIDFVTGFSLSTDWKSNSYDLILVIVDCLIKIVQNKPVKNTINIASLAKVIIDVVVKYYHSLTESILNHKNSLFILKFWSFLYYFWY